MDTLPLWRYLRSMYVSETLDDNTSPLFETLQRGTYDAIIVYLIPHEPYIYIYIYIYEDLLRLTPSWTNSERATVELFRARVVSRRCPARVRRSRRSDTI